MSSTEFFEPLGYDGCRDNPDISVVECYIKRERKNPASI